MRGDGPITARPWEEVIAHYRALLVRPQWGHIAGLLRLVEHIRDSPLGSVLHGAHSHAQLLLSPVERFSYDVETLQVDADPIDGDLSFRYSGAAGGPRWHRRAPASEGPEALERFVREIAWTVESSRG
jgi:hypothetical protein